MSDKCENGHSSIYYFFNGYERIIILIFIFLSFILNLLIIISIIIVKNKSISLILRVTCSILIVNFINIFSYSFQWNKCQEKTKDDYYKIELLSGDSNNLNICKFQSFLLLFSSMSQDYLIILFVYIVNKRTLIKTIIINILIIASIIFPLFIAFVFAMFDGLGINDDFCHIKKYIIENNTENNYIIDEYFNIRSVIIYGIRFINFIITVLFLIKIIKYIKNDISNIHFLNKLYIFFIQLFKLFVIFSYRFINLIVQHDIEDIRKIYVILSSIDGVLIPLVYSYSNEIFQNIYYKIKPKSITEIKKEIEGSKNPFASFNQSNIEDEKEEKTSSTPTTQSINNENKIEGKDKIKDKNNSDSCSHLLCSDLCDNTNNFDFSF